MGAFVGVPLIHPRLAHLARRHCSKAAHRRSNQTVHGILLLKHFSLHFSRRTFRDQITSAFRKLLFRLLPPLRDSVAEKLCDIQLRAEHYELSFFTPRTTRLTTNTCFRLFVSLRDYSAGSA